MVGSPRHKQQLSKWKVPDGGWGWMIVLGTTIVMVLASNLHLSYGVMFSKWYSERDIPSTHIGVIFNINAVLFNIMFLLIGPLTEEFGWRVIGMLSNFLTALAIILSAFATTVTHLLLSYSILGGIFGGLSGAQVYTILPKFFDKRLGIASAFPMAAYPLCQFIFPVLVPYLQDQYGFKGSMLLLGGLMLHSVVAAALFQPPEWHRIKLKGQDTRDISLTENNSGVKGLAEQKIGMICLKEMACTNKKIHQPNNVETLKENLPVKIRNSVICILKSAANNFSILKRPSALILSLSFSIFLSSTINFVVLVPFVIVNNGYSLEEAGLILSYGAITNGLARFSSNMLSDFKWFNIPFGYVCGTLLSFISIIGFAFANNLIWLTISFALQGFGHGIHMGLFTLVTKEVVGVDNHSASIGTSGAMVSVGFLILGPLVGYIKDSTGSYTVALVFIASLNALSFLLWIAMPFAKSYELKGQRKANKCNNDDLAT